MALVVAAVPAPRSCEEPALANYILWDRALLHGVRALCVTGTGGSPLESDDGEKIKMSNFHDHSNMELLIK